MRPDIIDIEASGFGVESYPIEVGVILGNGEKYCSLIQPMPHWTHWDREAERLHGISRDHLLTRGKRTLTVAKELNRLLKGRTAYSDGWVVDKPWMNALFYSAGIPMEFSLSPLELILSEEQMDHWSEARAKLIQECTECRHRASFDAWLVQETFLRTQ